MSENEVLSKAEVGALLEGVADGVVATSGGVTAKGEVSALEFKSSHNVSSYCPASLVNVYSRLSRKLAAGLYGLLRRDVTVELETLRRHRYDEYIATLQKPVCIHSVGERSLPGTALIVLDPALIYAFVDHYFGGAGEAGGAAAERDPTPAEVRMSQKLLQLILDKLTQAWSEVDDMSFAAQGFETDPALVTVAASPESMLVAKFSIDVAGISGDCHLAMPLSMLAPVRAKLEASSQGSLRGRERFQQTMRRQLRNVAVVVRGNLCEAPLTLRAMLRMAPGDVIPVDLTDAVVLRVDEAPVISGRFGTSRGLNAVCMTHRENKRHLDNDSKEAQ